MKIAYYLPEQLLTNRDLTLLFPDWSEEKIYQKTGIRQRHIAGRNETALDLGEKAALILFDQYGIKATDIDFILFCTQSPDYKLPTSACILQARLGVPMSAGALDFNLGCSGFVYGLSLAKGLIMSQAASKVLLVTAETYSKYLAPNDRSVRTIFGDGAAAVFIDHETASMIGDFSFGTDGRGFDKLIFKYGGARYPLLQPDVETPEEGKSDGEEKKLYMDGVEIFNFTLDIVPGTIEDVLEKNKLTLSEIDMFVFHQANAYMLKNIRNFNSLPREKFLIDLEDTGNTVSSTIPIALMRAFEKEKIKTGMKIMVMGFGVGLSWGATILTW